MKPKKCAMITASKGTEIFWAINKFFIFYMKIDKKHFLW